MRILFIGDIVGRSGRTILLNHMPKLIAEWRLDLVVVNGENAAGGFGITESIYNDFIDAGADAITLGNHAWDQREALVFIERAPRLIRPINFPPGTPGLGMLNENLAHAAGGRTEEMCTVLECEWSGADQPQIGFVYQCGGLERMVRTLAAQECRRHAMQFRIKHAQQLVHCRTVAIERACEEQGHVLPGMSVGI